MKKSKLVRKMCLVCDQVVNLDLDRLMVLPHYINKPGYHSCDGAHEYRSLTARERAWDFVKRLLAWRAFLIMILVGTPIMLFNNLAFGLKPGIAGWLPWTIWFVAIFLVSFIIRRLGLL